MSNMKTNNGQNQQQYEQVGELVSIYQRGTRWYTYYRHCGKPIRQSLKTHSKKEARRRALAIERDLINGELRRPSRAPLITVVIQQYMAHLRALNRAPTTLQKYQFGFSLILDLAQRRGISRIDQLDLAFVDAFRLERKLHRVKPKEKIQDGQKSAT